MAKTNGFDFDFGKQFGALEAQLNIITRTVIDLDKKVDNNFGLFEQKFTDKIDLVDTKVLNLAKRTGDLEHNKTELDRDFFWIKTIGSIFMFFILGTISLGSGILQSVLSSVIGGFWK